MLHPETLILSRAFADAGVTAWLIGGQATDCCAAATFAPTTTSTS
jgi:hypothetical protein